MGLYLIKRFNLFLATSVVLFAVLFIATKLFPVSTEYAVSGIKQPNFEQTAKINKEYDLSGSQLQQFIAYSSQRISGNMGISTTSQQSVYDELKAVLPTSFELAIVASFIAIALGVPLGILASLSKSKFTQNMIMALTLTGYSIPVFWLGLTLSLWFGVKLGWLPISGQINLLYEIKPVTGFMLIDTLLSQPQYQLSAFKDAILHIILPALTLAMFPFTVVARSTRDAMNNVMGQTYISAAEARGLTTHKVILRHALPNALLPVIKHLGIMLGTFASYAIIVEVIFSWPGVGSWLVSGIYQRDYTVIQGGILAVALVIVFFSIVIDVLYTASSPLIRKELYASN